MPVGVPRMMLILLRGEDVDGFVEPGEVEAALFGLHVDPGEFGQADDIEAGLAHELCVGLPASLGPVFRVVVNADVHEMLLLLDASEMDHDRVAAW